jgi:hypothetical protein
MVFLKISKDNTFFIFGVDLDDDRLLNLVNVNKKLGYKTESSSSEELEDYSGLQRATMDRYWEIWDKQVEWDTILFC